MEPGPRTAGGLSPRQLGRAGERAAAAFLERRGYRVVGSGFLARRGEIDLVCRRGDELVMVEVKTRSGTGYGTPAEAIDVRKRRALSAAASEYRALSAWRGPIRFAIVTLLVDTRAGTQEIELIEDPF